MRCLLKKFTTVLRNSKEQYENVDISANLMLNDMTGKVYIVFDHISSNIHFNENLVNSVTSWSGDKYFIDTAHELSINIDFMRSFIKDSLSVLYTNNIDYKNVKLLCNVNQLIYGGF